MTTTMNSIGNGRKRPNLSDQIDRLDTMLDGLSESLNDAVADAVKETVTKAAHAAVQGVLAQVLTDPAVIARMHAAVAPAQMMRMPVPPARPRLQVRERLKALLAGIRTCIADVRAACASGVRNVRMMAATCLRRAAEMAANIVWPSLQIVRRFKLQIVTAIAMGAVLGVLAWHAGPNLAAVSSGVGGFCTTLSVQAGLFLRRMLGGPVEQDAHA